jgi:hypothetical protein
VTELFRVFPYNPSAAPRERGGALFIPDPSDGRIANPDLYRELYAAGSPEAAIAERFGRYVRWRRETFQPTNGLPYALALLRLPDGARICDLDDTGILSRFGIARATHVITPQRQITQAWARRIFASADWDGICWWSHYYASYRIYGIWNTDIVSNVADPTILSIDSDEVAQTARALVRQRDS